MTENRTAIDIFAAFGTKMMVVLLLVLAIGARSLDISRVPAIACERSRGSCADAPLAV
jgi:hypothetical protein